MSPKLPLGVKNSCDAICRTLSTFKQWYQPDITETELGSNPSELEFAIQNLFMVFVQKTKQLCKNHSSVKEIPKSTLPKFPPAIQFSEKKSLQAEIEVSNRRLEDIKNFDHTTDPLLQKLEKIVNDTTTDKKEKERILRNIHEFNTKRSRIRFYQNSTPKVYTNSLVYGLALANWYKEITPQQELLSKEWKEWSKKVEESTEYGLKNYSDFIAKRSESIYSNFAIGLSVLKSKTAPSNIIEYMKEVESKQESPCTIPYDKRESHQGLLESDTVYRSVIFYCGLYRHASSQEKQIYLKKLLFCLDQYSQHLPRASSHSKTGEWMHIGKGNIAPYYFYGTIPFVSEEVARLLQEKSLPNSERQRLEVVLMHIRDYALDQFQLSQNLFINEPNRTYTNRSSYYNPLLALALEPVCRMEQGAF